MDSNDVLMYNLLQAKQDGTKIKFRHKLNDVDFREVEADHAWNLKDNDYVIEHRREFVVKIAKGGNNASIIHHGNPWTRSDYGMESDGTEYILVREVYQSDM